MIEIKITYYPPADSTEGALSISERLTIPALRADVLGDISAVAQNARRLYLIIKNNCPTLMDDLK